MAGERKITVTFDGKDVGLKKAADDAVDTVKDSGDRIGSSFKDVGKIAGGFLVAELTTQLADWAGKGLSWLWDGTQLASSTKESMNKVDAVFGDSAGTIKDFAKGADKSLGISNRAALTAAGNFGNMFDQLGLGGGAAADMSTDLITLAADLGSFNEADITDVLESQQSAFRGEYDSLQKFIPTINAAAVEQEALAATGKKSAKELTEQDKALAVYSLMLKGSGKAQGDFARTIGSTANQAKVAGAEAENLQTSLGDALLPITNKVTEAKRKLVGVLANDVVPWLTETGGNIRDKLAPAFDTIKDKVGEFWSALTTGKTEDEGTPLERAALGIRDAWGKVKKAWDEELQPAFQELMDAGREITEDIDWAKVWEELGPILAQVGAIITDTVVLIITAIGQLVSVTASAIQEMKEQWDKHKAIRDTVREVWDWIYTKISTGLSLIQGVIRLVTSLIQGDWSGAWKAIKQIAGAIWDSIGADFRAFTAPIRQAASTVWNGLSSSIGAVVNEVERQLNRLISVYNNTVGRLPGVGDIKPIGGTSSTVRKLSSTIPKFADGGIVTGPTLGWFEGKQTEAVVPLDRAESMGFGGGGNGTVHVQVLLDGQVILDALRRQLGQGSRIQVVGT
jgi:hypothetical protein